MSTAPGRPPKKRVPLTPLQQGLAGQYLPLALALARPWQRKFPQHRDDLESAATLGLVQAAQSFGPGRDVKFATFAAYRIRGAIQDALRGAGLAGFRWKGQPGEPPEVGHLDELGEESGRVVAPPPDPLSPGPAFDSLIDLLTPRQARVFREIYLHDDRVADAAARAGCSTDNAFQLHKKGLKRLRLAIRGRP